MGFFYSDHDGDSVDCCSRTDFIVLLSLIILKNRGICETSSFGSEYIAMKS